jgi:hypothetical protein
MLRFNDSSPIPKLSRTFSRSKWDIQGFDELGLDIVVGFPSTWVKSYAVACRGDGPDGPSRDF